MQAALATFLNRLDDPVLSATDVIQWGAPVPSFGDVTTSRVATIGLNPSNREFVDGEGNELEGEFRRFHTLKSLGLESWADASTRHLNLIIGTCRDYFRRNPYDLWFKRLDQVLVGTKASFYGADSGACHLDLIPYATASKWTELSGRQKMHLLEVAADALGLLLRESSVEVLILNGRSVVDQFQAISQVELDAIEMEDWALNRNQKPMVKGIAYSGVVSSIAGVELNRRIIVLGYNHNIQSSFGVTNQVVLSIQRWISKSVEGVL